MLSSELRPRGWLLAHSQAISVWSRVSYTRSAAFPSVAWVGTLAHSGGASPAAPGFPDDADVSSGASSPSHASPPSSLSRPPACFFQNRTAEQGTQRGSVSYREGAGENFDNNP